MTAPGASERGASTFVTFYSFKGGVGRSLALVNVATILAGLGRRVLIIDFDLEAPGVTLLISELAMEGTVVVRGVVDLIRDVIADPSDNVLTKDGFALAQQGYILPLKIPSHVDHIPGGILELLPSGRFEQAYADQFYEVDLAGLYREGLGYAVFERLKRTINDSARYDYVLIDSRTGLSDESGICTRDLADRLIIMTGLNRQNVEGTCFFLERAQSWGGSLAGRILMVLSPIPLGYEVVRRERQDELMARVRKILKTHIRDPLSLSYHPRLALDEDPSFEEWASSPLFQDYRKLSNAILEMAEDTPLDTLRKLQRALIEGDTDRVPLLLDELRARDETLLKAVYDTILTGPPVQAVVAPEKDPPRPDRRAYLRRLAGMWSTDVLVRIRLGWQERDFGDFEAATEALSEAVRVAQANGGGLDEATAREELAKVLHLRSQYDVAETEFKAALRLNDELNRASGRAACTHSIGEIRRTRGLYSLARADFIQASEQNQRIGRNQGIASNLHGLGLIDLFVGHYAAARQRFEESKDINTRVGRWHGVASNNHALAWIEYCCGDYGKAEELFVAADEVASTLGRKSAMAAAQRGRGRTAEAQGDYLKARTFFDNALSLEITLKRPSGQLSSRRFIASLQLTLGQGEEAFRTLDEILRGEIALGRAPLAASTLLDLGLAAVAIGDKSALRHLAQSETEFRALGCHSLAETCRRDAIHAKALIMNDWSQAPAELALSVSRLSESGNVVAATYADVLLAEAWQQVGQPQRSLDTIEGIEKSLDRLPALARFFALTLRGQARLAIGDPQGIQDLQASVQFFLSGGVHNRISDMAEDALNRLE